MNMNIHTLMATAPVEFDGEILYPEPIKADDILIDILIAMINESQ